MSIGDIGSWPVPRRLEAWRALRRRLRDAAGPDRLHDLRVFLASWRGDGTPLDPDDPLRWPKPWSIVAGRPCRLSLALLAAETILAPDGPAVDESSVCLCLGQTHPLDTGTPWVVSPMGVVAWDGSEDVPECRRRWVRRGGIWTFSPS